jgi:hypothetical protein
MPQQLAIKAHRFNSVCPLPLEARRRTRNLFSRSESAEPAIESEPYLPGPWVLQQLGPADTPRGAGLNELGRRFFLLS